MALIDIQVPDIGDFDQVTVIELLVKPGDSVKAEQSLITVESDKASMEIPSSRAGVVRELRVALGDKVAQGSVVLVLEAADAQPDTAPAAAAPAPAPAAPVPSAPVAPTPAAPAPAGAAAPVEVRVPDIGDFKDVTVIEVLVQPGANIKLEQSLVTVESDKASMEIPSSVAGVLQEIRVKVGDKVNIGDLLAVVLAAAPAAAAPVPAPAAPAASPAAAPQPSVVAEAPALAPAPAAAAPVPAHNPVVAPSASLPHASPSVRRIARLLGVPLEEVRGTGPKGRITELDLQGFTRSVMSGVVQTRAAAAAASKAAPAAPAGDGGGLGLLPWPKVDFAKFGPVERQDRPRIKKISAANLHRNWVLIPHVTNHDDADITDLEAFRVLTNKENEKSGVKVTMLAFLIKACVAALRRFPEFNSSLDGDQLVLKRYYHIGFAADTPQGLMVPVIKDADTKGVLQISQEMADLAKKARDGKLSPGDMSGASFTISSLGGIGGRYFTPIINAPEVAILGVCRSTMQPVWNGSVFEPRLMLPLSLSWDHRVIDGAAAARFNAYLGQILGDFRRVLL
ncbi:MAG: dihydrolipoyllysine-residue acetyltransferase [Rhodoferax sp.]|jgi:pyruvate dehydrogenase E2 component (dihydrolipoamide acetyltransferase)|nr:dihydrolipoyllysine-residue acetyltransferase [Rhodoferax sp.]